MKLLTLHDLNKEDSLSFSLHSALDGHSEIEHELEFFFQALEEHAGAWMPTRVEGRRGRKYSRPALWKALEEARDQYGAIIGLDRPASPAVSLTLDLGLAQTPPSLGAALHVQPVSFFAGAERCREFVELVRAWTSHYPVLHASAHSMADAQLAGEPYFGRDAKTARRDGFDKVYEVFWLNVFGPKLVEAIGRERVLSTPAHRVEALPNGSVLLVTWPIAADFASEPAREAQARAFVHLRPELDFDTVLSTLRERSQALAPVEPRFHPDVAPLLSRTLDFVAISERQRKVAELNAYPPPVPEEWLPVDTALPVDVADVAGAVHAYASRAEQLVALLHTQVPSVFEATPESLTEVDFHFWRENFPEVFERPGIDEHAVPAIGAYLGQVLVRHLGGQWLPRRDMLEAQVRVGNRVWLPFARAHRYMGSRQALLDYSLTQLFREAARVTGAE